MEAALKAVLDGNKAQLLARVAGQSLNNDEVMRSVAGYCHDMLPWPVRVTVKKPAFVDFVLGHREIVLSRLVPRL